MSKSEPVDPMSFTTARTELWMRLAGNAGFDSEGNPTASADPAEWESKGYAAEEYFHERLRDDALVNLAGAGMVGVLRVWEANGRHWRRVPHKSIFEIAHHPDEVGSLYVDREEFEAMLLARYPLMLSDRPEGEAGEPSGAKGTTSKLGRPKGPGYSPRDVSIYEKILEKQRTSGNIHSQHSLVTEFSGNPNDSTNRTNIERLRKGLPNWLKSTGHEWFPPNNPQ